MADLESGRKQAARRGVGVLPSEFGSRGLRAPPSTQWHREVRDLRECAVRPAALFLLCRWSARSAWAISLSSSLEGRGGWIDQSPIRGLSPSG